MDPERSNDLGEIGVVDARTNLLTFDAQLARIAVLLEKNDLCTTEQTILDLFQRQKEGQER